MADAYGNVMTGPSGITTQAEVKPVEILYSTHRLVQKGGTFAADNGVIVGGTAVGLITASGKYAPYDGAAADGTETCRGFLRQSVDTDGRDMQGNIVFGGVLKNDALTGVDAAAITDLNARVDDTRNIFSF